MAKTKETEEGRAVHIASIIMQAAGLCRYDDIDKCRHLAPTDADCVKCIEGWLLSKARSEIRKEGRA